MRLFRGDHSGCQAHSKNGSRENRGRKPGWGFYGGWEWSWAEGSQAWFKIPTDVKGRSTGLSYQLAQMWGRRIRKGRMRLKSIKKKKKWIQTLYYKDKRVDLSQSATKSSQFLIWFLLNMCLFPPLLGSWMNEGSHLSSTKISFLASLPLFLLPTLDFFVPNHLFANVVSQMWVSF